MAKFRVVVLLCICFAFHGAATPQVTFDDSGVLGTGVVLKVPSSAEFRNRAASLEQAGAGATLREMEPYSALVVNSSSKPVWAVALVYEITLASGKVVRRTYERTGFATPGRNWEAGGAYLVTPIGDESIARSPQATQQWSADKGLFQGAATVSVALSIDSVVDMGGRFFGPDKVKSLDRYHAWMRADLDLLGQVKASVDRGDTDGAILAVLRGKFPRKPAATWEDEDQYALRQEALARSLANWLSHLDRQTLGKRIETMITRASNRRIER